MTMLSSVILVVLLPVVALDSILLETGMNHGTRVGDKGSDDVPGFVRDGAIAIVNRSCVLIFQVLLLDSMRYCTLLTSLLD